jgi:3-hydroxyisobutyrate dehydrogenase
MLRQLFRRLTMIAFLGMGLLGSNFVRAGLARGEPIRIWNRSGEKARALAELGAQVCDTPEDAVRGAGRVHLTLSDDSAVDAVLDAARAGLASDVAIVDHTTTSPAGTRERAVRFRERGVKFMHAPVFMGPKNALDSSGVMLASGEPALFEQLRPALEKMTGRLVHVGDDPERAASFKLLGNLFLMFMTGGLAELFTLAKALGIDPPEAAQLFEIFNPASTLRPRVERMLAANWSEPSWELQMARKDARLMLEGAERGGTPLAVLPALAALMDRFLARGHGHDDWTVIASDALKPR